jgi:hypothetical protein
VRPASPVIAKQIVTFSPLLGVVEPAMSSMASV